MNGVVVGRGDEKNQTLHTNVACARAVDTKRSMTMRKIVSLRTAVTWFSRFK